MKNTPSDDQLQERLRSDDKAALEGVYNSYRKEFLYYCARYPIDKTAILDIYQDAIIAMHQNFVMSQVVLTSSSIKTYLFGIGKNKLYKKLKEQNRVLLIENEVSDAYESIDIESQLPTENQVALAKNIAKISESCQIILKLFYYRGLTIEEIVDMTNYKDGNTVRSQKSRCLKQLKSLFKIH